MTDLSAFSNFIVPDELIAQKPASPAESARLMVVRRSKQTVETHYTVKDLPQILDDSYVLVVNNSKVVDCKLQGYWANGESNQSKIEKDPPQVFYILEKCAEEKDASSKKSAHFLISGEGLDTVKAGSKIHILNSRTKYIQICFLIHIARVHNKDMIF